MSYVGEIQDRLRHGHGTYTFPGGFYKYTGDWVKGKMHGHGIFFLGDGSTYEGNFENGEIQGNGLRRWPDGTTYSGEFRRGEMHGEGVYIASSGKKYEGSWKDNQFSGFGELIDVDGSIYTGEFLKHKPHGQGRKIYPDKSTYDGEWFEGHSHGTGSWASPEGTSYQGEWKLGLRHGRGKAKWPNGLEYEGNWTENVRDKYTRAFAIVRLSPDGTTDPTPLVFREDVVADDSAQNQPAPAKTLPSFRIDCLCDANDGALTEESKHGIRVSLFKGKNPNAPPEVDPEADKKSKRNSVADVTVTQEIVPPILLAFVNTETQESTAELTLCSTYGSVLVPPLEMPADAAPGDYFLQVDSTIDFDTIPSAFYSIQITRGDDNAGKKDAKKK